MKALGTFLLASLIILFALPQQSAAIPAFARKYKVSCSTCHTLVPKLKSYGEEFAANGFRLPDAPEPPRTYVDAGDDMLTLHRFIPLAIRFDGFLQYAKRDAGEFDFQAPYGVKLLSGGPVTDNISYYLYFYMSERGEITGLEDAFVQFNNLFGSNFDLFVGQFQVCDPLFKRELRLTLEDYEVYRMRPEYSHANLTYDRGVILNYGFDFGLDLTVQALNGNGIGPAENKVFDIDNGKAVAFRASQHIGPVRIGGFYYRGEELYRDFTFSYESGASQMRDVKNVLQYFGPDITVGNDYLELNAQYLHRIDSDMPYQAPLGTMLRENTMDGLMAELIYMPDGPMSNWGFVGMYNMTEDKDNERKYQTATLSVSRLLARNFRLIGEVTYDLEAELPRVSLGFVSGF
ncbi:MAG: hypothetical protein WBQ23_13765 [Bacteroidota bacterium]